MAAFLYRAHFHTVFIAAFTNALTGVRAVIGPYLPGAIAYHDTAVVEEFQSKVKARVNVASDITRALEVSHLARVQ